jgi:serine/tyrosine/threonine adenylyltransferase
MPVRIPFDNTYARRLPDRFFARLDPAPVAAPRLVRVNAGLAEELWPKLGDGDVRKAAYRGG